MVRVSVALLRRSPRAIELSIEEDRGVVRRRTHSVGASIVSRYASASAPACLFAVLASVTRCAGTLEDPGRFADAGKGVAAEDAGGSPGAASDATPAAAEDVTTSCPDVPQAVFLPNCTSAGCHNAQDKEQGLDLQSPDVAARLINVSSSEGAGLLIDPAAPASSVLYTKLTPNPPFGAQMPTKGALDGATIACDLSWITEEANAPAGSHEGGASAESGSADASVGAGHDD
jgi:hypothetical protein